MLKTQSTLALRTALLLAVSAAYGPTIYAAKALDLSHQKINILTSIQIPQTANLGAIRFKETSRAIDLNQTMHVRAQETYMGHPVYGGDFIIHIPNGSKTKSSMNRTILAAEQNKGSMDGVIYQHIKEDLANTPAYVFGEAQSNKALQQAVNFYQREHGQSINAKNPQRQLFVFIDQKKQAHWAYRISFDVEPSHTQSMPAKPVVIMDAISLKIYESWDDIKTLESAAESGGGYGGNKKMGKMVYDGLSKHLPKLNIMRDAETQTCFLQNSEVTIKPYRKSGVVSFTCEKQDEQHNNVFWDAELEAVNEGYSPSNDALFGGAIIKDMYQKWYGIPVLEQNGKPMMLTMVVHAPIDNAYWDGTKMTFGDGVRMFYPLTSLGVAAHEISHGFTEQHAGLRYYGQSGGMNESFSDMAAQAAEYFAYQKNSWQIGPEIFKAKDEALRYMDKPSKDCGPNRKPGNWCSIDDASQYRSGIDVHYSSGVYNRFFYLLGTAKGWDPKKAFDVMVHANMNYWTSSTDFQKGACGVIKAAKDLHFEARAILQAFSSVKIDTKEC